MQGRAPAPLSKEPLFRSDVSVGRGTRALSGRRADSRVYSPFWAEFGKGITQGVWLLALRSKEGELAPSLRTRGR